jgi:hypothetical protein
MDITKLQIGDIGFSFKKGNLFSRFIYAVSIWKKNLKKPEKKMSHAFIYIGNGLIAESTFGGAIIVNVKKYLDEKHATEFQTPLEPLTDLEKQEVFKLCAEQVGIVKYGWGQLFVILFNKWFKLKQFDFSLKQMHCSEFVANIYEKLNRKLINEESSMADPVSLYESEKIKDII